MSKEIIINVTGEHSRIAIVEDGELVELYIENPENVRTIGDIYLGRVRRILPGIKAAFVDIGQKQDAFLHFSDLSDNLPDLLELSDGKVADHLKKHLAKAPRQPEDGDSGLELETPQEQRAARRRRDLKRTHGKGRRGRKESADTPETAQTSPQAEEKQPEEKPQKTPREAEPRKSGRRSSGSKEPRGSNERGAEPRGRDEASRSSRPQPVAQPPVSDEVPDRPPAILPPDAVQPPPGADELAADTPGTQTEQPTDEAPKKRRRGGRGRGRKTEPRADDATSTEQPDARQRRAEDDRPDDAKPKRTRPSQSREAEERSEAPAAAPELSEPTDTTPEGDQAEARPKRKKKSERPSDKRDRKADKPDAEQEGREPKKPTPAARTEPAAKSEPPARGSRFVIDLTSKSGSTRPGREEEEEEEEQRSSRSRRSSGRRRGGRRRNRSGAQTSTNGSDSNASGSKGTESKSSGNSDPDDQERRSRGRGDGGSRGSESRNGGSRHGGSRSSGGSHGPRPETHLKQDQKLIVKITKEPISAKGPRVSTDVSLAGRFLVLIPQADYVAVSKKIESSKERRRLRALARSLLPEGFGLIVRTVAENRDAKALDTDLRLLLQKWHKIEDQLRKKPNPPVALYEDVNMVSSIIRDLFSEDYDRIVVDDPKVHRNVKNYVQAVAPQMAPAVQLHKGKEHVFRTYKIDAEVRAAFERRVPLPGGGYLFIEHTEAMHVVDVNSGRAGRGLSQEENSLRVNLESARVIAKQLRLRDLGGIIVVDFIDMRSESARKKVYDELKKEFRKDRAVTKLLPMSDFGVVQITRQRLRPSITTTTNVEDLPQAEDEPDVLEAEAPAVERVAAPAGPQPTAAEVVGKLERWLATYRDEVQDQHRKRPIVVRLHPFLAAYLQRGIPSLLTRWKFRTRLNFRLDVDESADPLVFSVRDEKSGKNLTKKYDRDLRTTDDE